MQSVSGMLMPDDVTLEISNTGKFQIKDTGVSNAKLAGNISNDKLAGNISNDKLAGNISDDKLASTFLKPFGAWTAKDIGTIYQAESDGILCAAYTGNDVSSTFSLLSDASTPPTVARSFSHVEKSGTQYAGAVCPVKKNEYYRVTSIGGGTPLIYWLPTT